MLKTISYDDFISFYSPVKNHINTNAAFDGFMFETFGDEVSYIKTVNPENVWTIVSGDNDSTLIISGLHFVNRLGYIITDRSHEGETEVSFTKKNPKPYENYERINKLVPNINTLEKNQAIVFKLPVMDCLVTLKKKGISVALIEICFCTQNNGQYVPDHSIRVKMNHQDKLAIPESVWFKCRGTTKVRIPEKGDDSSILRVQNKTLHKWLDNVQASYA